MPTFLCLGRARMSLKLAMHLRISTSSVRLVASTFSSLVSFRCQVVVIQVIMGQAYYQSIMLIQRFTMESYSACQNWIFELVSLH